MDFAGRLGGFRKGSANIVNRNFKDYLFGTNWFTKQERLVFLVAIGLLLTGWAVKFYRTAHPPVTVVEEQKH